MKLGLDACISSRITTVIHVVSNHQINYNCFNEPFAVSPYRSLYWDMHGLIFETSIWLLAGSTRFLQLQPTIFNQEFARSKPRVKTWLLRCLSETFIFKTSVKVKAYAFTKPITTWDNQDVESKCDASTLTSKKLIQQILPHFHRQDNQLQDARSRSLNHSHPWDGVLRPAPPGNPRSWIYQASCFLQFWGQFWAKNCSKNYVYRFGPPFRLIKKTLCLLDTEPTQARPGFVVIHDNWMNRMASAGDKSFKFLTYQLPTVGYWPTAVSYTHLTLPTKRIV